MRCLTLLSCLLAVFWIPVNSAEDTAVVQTSYGPIKGHEVTYEATKYKAFKGIPYAAPPLGELRFAAPKPPAMWTEVREATDYGDICIQIEDVGSQHMSEDCLTLNVFTDSLDDNNLKPVLFWIHGQAISPGDGTDNIYGPQYLIKEGIVIVTINYRLGGLGFLTTDTPKVSGNWGLKDQVAALKWVQENIAHFGGDPKQVTIYGESGGAISVHLHLFSPISKGLFSKAIVSSGAATIRQAVRRPERVLHYSSVLANILEAPETDIENPDTRIDFLRKADAVQIEESILNVLEKEDWQNPLFALTFFAPVIEDPGTEGAFLVDEPKKLLEEGGFTKVPLMIGLNDLEGGIMLVGFGKDHTTERMKEAENDVCDILPECLQKAVEAKNECSKVAKEISKTYFDGRPLDSSLPNFINLCGDLSLLIDVHLAQRLHARATKEDPPIYNYYFTFDGKWNMAKNIYEIHLPGATHGDDISYVFKPAIEFNESSTSPEAITRDRMVRLVTNFVKHGDPTPAVSDLIPVKWEPSTDKEPIYMVIGNEMRLEKEFLKTRMEMWDRLYKEYTGKPLFSLPNE